MDSYKIGIYVRLSKEDLDKEGGDLSKSITNQTNYLVNYAKQRDWYNIYKVYVEDGLSGGNFNRPSFQEMLADIEEKKINLIIVKDFSRLGRNSSLTDYYVFQHFPERKIRIISINNDFDSEHQNSNSKVVGKITMVLDEHNLEVISVSSRSILRNKMKSGQFIGSFAPYGYKKSKENKNKLVIDEDTRPIIISIFNNYLEGKSMMDVAMELNKKGIPSPSAYKKYYNLDTKEKYNCAITNNLTWSPSGVKEILKNRIYCGEMTQHKFTTKSYNNKKLLRVPEDQWEKYYLPELAIITEETYNTATDLMKKKAASINQPASSPQLWTGLIFCGDCGAKMTYIKSAGTRYCICSGYKIRKSCTRHAIKEIELTEEVINDLKDIIKNYISKEELYKNVKSTIPKKRKIHTFEDELQKVIKNENQIILAIQNAVLKNASGVIGDDIFNSLMINFSKELEDIKISKKELELKLDLQKRTIQDMDVIKQLIEDFFKFEKTNKVILAQLIEKIEVFKNKKIKIFYKFKPPEDL